MAGEGRKEERRGQCNTRKKQEGIGERGGGKAPEKKRVEA